MTPPGSPGGGVSLDFAADIRAGVGQLAAEIRADRDQRNMLAASIFPLDVPLTPVSLSGGAGTLDIPVLLGPRQGWVWQLDGMGAQGFTVGTVAVYVNSTSGLELFNFTSAGTFYQRHFRYLRAGQRLVFSATSITGTVSVWVNGFQFREEIQGAVYL